MKSIWFLNTNKNDQTTIAFWQCTRSSIVFCEDFFRALQSSKKDMMLARSVENSWKQIIRSIGFLTIRKKSVWSSQCMNFHENRTESTHNWENYERVKDIWKTMDKCKERMWPEQGPHLGFRTLQDKPQGLGARTFALKWAHTPAAP